jgi:hypothetical protein
VLTWFANAITKWGTSCSTIYSSWQIKLSLLSRINWLERFVHGPNEQVELVQF